MTLSDALLVADGYGGDAAQALAVLAAEMRRLHALLDGADELASNPTRPGRRRRMNFTFGAVQKRLTCRADCRTLIPLQHEAAATSRRST